MHMNNIPEFQPGNEDEKQFMEQYNKLSDFMSEKLRSIDEKDRLTVLKDLKPSDLSLMNLYLRAYRKEDYETCTVAKVLLEE